MMKKVRAFMHLYSGPNKRKTPFVSGYRPLFDVYESSKISGQINLMDREFFRPGESGVVIVNFLEAELKIGEKLSFYEGQEALGEITVLEVFE